MLHPFDCGTVGVGAACVLEEAHFGSSRLSGKEADDQQSGGQNIFIFITFPRLLDELNSL